MGGVVHFNDSFNICISGSRGYDNFWEFAYTLDDILALHQTKKRIRLFEGGAPGVDKLAAQYAVMRKVRHERFPADWDNLGKRAGYVRNADMVDSADMVIAFWDGQSKGTKHAIECGLKKRKRVIVVRVDRDMRIMEIPANKGFENRRMNDMFRNYEWFRLRDFLEEEFDEAA